MDHQVECKIMRTEFEEVPFIPKVLESNYEMTDGNKMTCCSNGIATKYVPLILFWFDESKWMTFSSRPILYTLCISELISK